MSSRQRCSLLATRYSLLATRYSLLATRYSLLATRYSLLATRYSLLATRYDDCELRDLCGFIWVAHVGSDLGARSRA